MDCSSSYTSGMSSFPVKSMKILFLFSHLEISLSPSFQPIIIIATSPSAPITLEKLNSWTADFKACPKNVLAQNVCTKIDPFEACLSRERLQVTNHVFEFKVDNEGKPTTDQKNSGRCWIYAALNAIRIPFMKKYNLDEFEFSQSHLFYWDKIERCNHFLDTMVALATWRKEDLDSRLVQYKLNDPVNDGGQWTMISNLVKKYGLLPKKVFPESFCSGKSIRLNAILKSKLREYTHVIREMAQTNEGREVLNLKIAQQMQEIHKVVSICLGIPPQTFTWEYTDKAKKYNRVGPITALQFYEDYVRKADVFNMDAMVCLVSDPRPQNSYGKLYTIDCLGNVVGGEITNYNNQPIDTLMEVTVASIKAGQPVWFGCDVSKRYAMKPGVEDLYVHDFRTLFDVDVQVELNKAQRLSYGESLMTHAMVFTGVSTDECGRATKFRVENSWGEDSGEKGYIVMSADWFREFVYEVAVERQYCSEEVLKPNSWTEQPVVLPAWDPMGALAE